MDERKLIITAGDPGGIGPFVVVDALDKLKLDGDIILIGRLRDLDRHASFARVKRTVELIEPYAADNDPGTIAFETLRKAVDIMRREKNAALVTAPVSKENIAKKYIEFSGHTEFLAEQFSSADAVMMMASERMRTVLLTRHVPLAEVSGLIEVNNIKAQINAVISGLNRYFGIYKPKLAFCSVNPHAGVDTFLRDEERKLISAISFFSDQCEIFGPYPSDTLFARAQDFDVIFSCYHDQGMIPFKLTSFYDGVNVTLGLPFLRTSPAHGTAFDIADKPDRIDSGSMQAAIRMALTKIDK